MNENKRPEEREFLVTFSDFKHICLRSKGMIIAAALIFGAAGLLYSLSKNISYEVQATYKEKGKTKNSEGSSLLTGFFSGQDGMNQSEARSLMSSRLLMEELVIRHNLHAPINPKRPPNRRWKNIRDNLKVEIAVFREQIKPGIAEQQRPFVVYRASYSGELPTAYELAAVDENNYDLYNASGRYLGRRAFGETVTTDDACFTIVYDPSFPLPTDTQMMDLVPSGLVADGILDKLSITPDPKDKTLLNLSFTHPDRHTAALVVNSIMSVYHDYLKKEQYRLAKEQLTYLKARREEASKQMSEILNKYAEEQSSDVATHGFPDVETAMKFLTSTQQAHKSKLLGLDLEAQRLQNVKKAGYAYYDRYVSDGDPMIINSLLQEMRDLKQKGDSIKIALQNNRRALSGNLAEAFEAQIAELEEVSGTLDELREVSNHVERGRMPRLSEKLRDDPASSISSWYENLLDSKDSWNDLPPYKRRAKEEQWNTRKEQFLAYLGNLIHNLEMRQKTLTERLSHQTGMSDEFEGIDLSLASELYVGYNRELNGIESQVLQNQFVIGNLQDEEFEVSSLNPIVHDSIGASIIDSYSNSLMALKDEGNRSSKEQERIRNELLLQRGFLEMHLSQSAQVLNLRAGLVRDKLFALQNTTLDLIQRKIGLIEQQLADYISTRVYDIEKERALILKQLSEINGEMAQLPKRWIAKHFLDQQMEMGHHLGREISQLFESKNINNNLEMIQSSPIDLAVVPLYPRRPYPLLYGMVGAFAGAFFSLAFFLTRAATEGLKASKENLEEMGFHVSGSLSQSYGKDVASSLHDDDLSVLRRAVAVLAPPKPGAPNSTTLLITGEGPDISKELAVLAAKRGLSVLLIPASLYNDGPYEGSLLEYLEGKNDFPVIRESGAGYSLITAGGCSRYGSELLCSERFRSLISSLSTKVDWIIGVCEGSAAGAEVQTLIPLFPHLAVCLHDEKLEQIRPFFAAANEEDKAATFIFQYR